MAPINSISMGSSHPFEEFTTKPNTDKKVQVDLTQKPDNFEKKSKVKKGAAIGAAAGAAATALRLIPCKEDLYDYACKYYKATREFGIGKGTIYAGLAVGVAFCAAVYTGVGALAGAGIGKIADVCTNKGNKE